MKPSVFKATLLTVALMWTAVMPTQAGWIKRYIYQNISGTYVTNLYGTNLSGVVVFPDSPDETELIPPGSSDLYYQAISIINRSDNFGSWTPGYIEPPETGNYTFWVCGDDETQLWLTSDAADPLNPTKKQMIAAVPGGGWSNAREWTKYAQQQSALIYLEKGKQYYMEVLHKEGTGGDNVGWGWQLPSGAVELPMRTFYLQPKKDTITTDPTLVYGPFSAPISPMIEGDTTVYDGMEVMLWVDLNLVPPYTVSWERGTTPITDAKQTYYRFRARSSDNGAQFYASVNGTRYGPLPLTVIADTTKPELASAIIPTNNPTQIQLVFSEPITPETATNKSNYSLNTATVQNAQLMADGRTVVLTTTLVAPNQFNTLTISGLNDWALPANTIATTQTNLFFADRALSFRIWYTSSVSSLATLRSWSATNSTVASYTNNLFNEERLVNVTSYQWNLTPLRNNYMAQMIGYLIPPVTGNYRFYTASDDHSVLYLGTNELRSSKREICYRDGSSGRWNVALSTNSSAISLVGGKRYYIEAVYRDGTGGDGITIAWETPLDAAAGRSLTVTNSSVQSLTEPFLIPTNYLSTYVTFGNIFLPTNLPASLSVGESTRPTLLVSADGTRPYAYQWYKNSTAIAGATAPSYTLPYVRSGDNGATFYVVANNSFSSVTSVVMTLTVTNDSTKPTVASVGSLYKQLIEVRLSEPVTALTAADTNNYLLFSSNGSPVSITAALQDTNDAAHITLQTAALPETDLMRLVIQNLADLSAAGNVMNPATNTFRANNFDTLVRINNSMSYSATAIGDQILMTAGGSDIWGTADQCAYLYKSVTGNFDYRVRGISLPAVNGWSKMGPMARASTASNSRNVISCFTPVTPGQNQYSPQVRDTTGGSSTSYDVAPLSGGIQIGVAGRPTISYPSWLRLQRVGETLYYYLSTNGTSWTYWTFYNSANSSEGPLPSTILFGLALTSHDTTNTVDGVLESFSAVDDGSLRFTLQPTNMTVVEGGTAVFTAAIAGHSPWYIEWSKNGTPIANATNTTLTLTMVPFSDNNSTITCRVTNPYNEVISATARLYVQEPDNTKPTVTSVGSLYKNTIEVYFSEGVTAASANATANYSLYASDGSSVGIASATIDGENAAHVTLTTGNMPETDLMRLVCRSIVDLSVAANVMNAQTNSFRANNFDLLERINNTQNYSARAAGDQVFMTAGGSDIWGTSDQCAFVYKTVSGNFDYKVQGISIGAANSWSKMGLMVRDSVPGAIVASSRNMFTCFTPTSGQNTYSPQVRPNGGANTTSSADAGTPLAINLQSGVTARPTVVYPSWLRLQRIGDRIYYYFSTTGTNWTFWTWYDSATSSDGPLPTDLLLGLAITSHDTSLLVDGVMAGFSSVNEGQLYFLTQPVSTSVIEGGNVTFTASVAGRGPYFYQWLKNGADIANATGSSLALTGIPVADNGAQYAIRVTNPYGDSITSTNAVLTVVQDTFKPVAYAVGSLRGASIGVYFNDDNKIDPVTASDPVNYVVNDGAVSVTSAILEPDGLAVMLTLGSTISGDFSVKIQNVKDGAPIANTVAPTTLSSTVVTWPLNQDVGTSAGSPPVFSDPLMPGFAQAIGTDGFYVHSGGSDIWNSADGMHFVYQAVTGDYDVAVRVAGLRMADVWSKAGLMVRGDLEGTARNYLIAATPTNGQNLITMQWRLGTNIASSSLVDALRPRPSPIPNAWLRITRAAQVFSFYYGTNGTDWVSLYTTNEVATPYPATVYVGAATTSHNNGGSLTNTTSAYFRNLTGLTAPVVIPVISYSVQGANLVLTWTTSDASFKLQSTATVNSGWANDPTTLTVLGNTYTATVPLGSGAKFYRLKK